MTIWHGDGSYISWKIQTGSAGTNYASCRVRYSDPVNARVIAGIAYADGLQPNKPDKRFASSSAQQLEVWAKVSSRGEAEALAANKLRLHNKYGVNVVLTMPGNPNLVSGVTVGLMGWGFAHGKYIVRQARVFLYR